MKTPEETRATRQEQKIVRPVEIIATWRPYGPA